MLGPFLRALSLGLAVTFTWAALAKITAWSRWRATVSDYGFVGFMGGLAVVSVPLAEAFVPVLLLAGAVRPAGILAAVLVCGFSLAILRAHNRLGERLPCGCFGGDKQRDFRVLLARNAILGAAGGLVASGDTSIFGGLPAPAADTFLPVVLTLVGIALIGALMRVAARHL